VGAEIVGFGVLGEGTGPTVDGMGEIAGCGGGRLGATTGATVWIGDIGALVG